jgi:hypothetical protein
MRHLKGSASLGGSLEFFLAVHSEALLLGVALHSSLVQPLQSLPASPLP